jgi:hypothetical protein
MTPTPPYENKEIGVHKILSEIVKIDKPKVDESRRTIFQEFISNAINGDELIDWLVIPIDLEAGNPGFLIYILTNTKLIKTSSDGSGMEANNYPLSTFLGINQKLLDDGKRFEFVAVFQNGAAGLRFSPDNKRILGFFQKIEGAKKNHG